MPPRTILDEIAEALERATPGPWSREKPARDADGWATGVAVAGTPGRQTIYAQPEGGSFPSADANLIPLLRNHAKPLLAVVRAAAEVPEPLVEDEYLRGRMWCSVCERVPAHWTDGHGPECWWRKLRETLRTLDPRLLGES